MSNSYQRNRASIQILVAEDSPTQAQHLAWILEDEGYQVKTVADGKLAFEEIEQGNYDLLISDVVMPEMNGYELCEKIRSSIGHMLPIMLVTSLKSPNDVLKGLQAGADNFLTKPYNDTYLVDQIDYLLSNRRLRGHRKMEVGIEIEFNNERHFITADRQQILDLLISTYHEAVYINKSLTKSSDRLQAKIEMQQQQLFFANQLQASKVKNDIYSAISDFTTQIEGVHSSWLTTMNEQSNGKWVLAYSNDLPDQFESENTLPICSCVKHLELSDFSARTCELQQEWETSCKHICIPIIINNEVRLLVNLLYEGSEDKLKDSEDALKIFQQQVETNLERIELLTELEARVQERTAQLELSQAKLKSVIESNLFGVLIIDQSGRVTFKNTAVQNILGYAIPESDNSFQFEAMLPKSGEVSDWQIFSSKDWSTPHNIELLHADGSKVPVLVLLKSLNTERGEEKLCVFLDMTELKRTEARLNRMQRLESVANLSGGIAHDFNNLLSVIVGNCDILLDDNSTEHEVKKASINIEKAAVSGTKLTKQLLSFARKQEFLLEPIDAKEVIFGVSEFVERLISKSISVKVECCADPWHIYTDYNQLESAILNLTINARDALSGSGEITIKAYNASQVDDIETLSEEPIQGDFLVIEVKDNGSGIPDEILENVFEPFFTTKAKDQGTGLGLSMVHGFVKQSNGFISVKTSSKGTRFKLYFPPLKEKSVKKDVQVAKSTDRGSGEYVLIVEDNPEVRWIMAKHIQSLGYNPIQAETFDSAMDAYDDNKDKIEVVCTDYNLTGEESGIDIIKRLLSKKSDLCFILSSGTTLEDKLHEFKESHRIRFLAKPYRRQDLAKVLSELLSTNNT